MLACELFLCVLVIYSGPLRSFVYRRRSCEFCAHSARGSLAGPRGNVACVALGHAARHSSLHACFAAHMGSRRSERGGLESCGKSSVGRAW